MVLSNNCQFDVQIVGNRNVLRQLDILVINLDSRIWTTLGKLSRGQFTRGIILESFDSKDTWGKSSALLHDRGVQQQSSPDILGGTVFNGNLNGLKVLRSITFPLNNHIIKERSKSDDGFPED